MVSSLGVEGCTGSEIVLAGWIIGEATMGEWVRSPRLLCLWFLRRWGRSAALKWGPGAQRHGRTWSRQGCLLADLDMKGGLSAHSESRKERLFLVTTPLGSLMRFLLVQGMCRHEPLVLSSRCFFFFLDSEQGWAYLSTCLRPKHPSATWHRVGKPEMKAQHHNVPADGCLQVNSHLGMIHSLLVAAQRWVSAWGWPFPLVWTPAILLNLLQSLLVQCFSAVAAPWNHECEPLLVLMSLVWAVTYAWEVLKLPQMIQRMRKVGLRAQIKHL